MKRRWLLLVLCAALLLGAAGCSQTGEESSSQISTPSSSAVESEPTPNPTPSPTPSPSPSPTPEPESSALSGEFEEAFADNPIDQKLEEDLAAASSTGLVLQAYNQAASLWQQLIQTAYEQAGEVLSTDSYALVQQEQGDWEAGLDPELQNIRAQHGEDEMSAAKDIVNYYKDRAKALCQAVYDATGQLPEFPSTSQEGVG